MSVDDRLAVRKPRSQAQPAVLGRAWDVHHPDARALNLDDPVSRKELPQLRLVHVSVDAYERRDRLRAEPPHPPLAAVPPMEPPGGAPREPRAAGPRAARA